MSGSRPTPAEQHLGDRLAALVDGELGHDSRERVLAHLATCAKCKAEADAQRRLKDVFAHSAPPGPSEGFLARLQGLPGGSADGDGPGDGEPPGRRRFGEGSFGAFRAGDDLRFGGRIGYEPGGAHPGVLPDASRDPGFRIHEVGRPETERTGARRPRRFAFAAASAVSLAAIALGGALPAETTNNPTARGERAGGLVPTRAATPAGGTDSSRRQGGAGSVGTGTTAPSGGTTRLSAATDRAGTASAPPVPYSTGLTEYPLALALAQRRGQEQRHGQGHGHGQGYGQGQGWGRIPGPGHGRQDSSRVFPASLLDSSDASPLIAPVPTAPPTSNPPASDRPAAPSASELSVSRAR
ncbi:zf-HC2 domain-containing protein [Streptomyces sp. NPDC048442]|uniref:anti-sigma factor family protein n=1 Tax=Streptomyces sp. NPDC048442 TaxID=3154823 RepID=UPI003437F8CB